MNTIFCDCLFTSTSFASASSAANGVLLTSSLCTITSTFRPAVMTRRKTAPGIALNAIQNKEKAMNEFLDKLNNKIYASRHRGQLPEIRKLWDLYLRSSNDYEDEPKYIYLAVGFIFWAIVFVALRNL